MKLAVLQPGYMPDLPLFALWSVADVVLLADDLQYSTRSNLNRTRIKTATGVQWLTVPVLSKGRVGQTIAEVEIDPYHEWRQRHWRTLQVNYTPAPFWGRYENALEEIYRRPWSQLLGLNVALLNMLVRELELPSFKGFTSSMPTRPDRTEKVLDLLEAFECHTYLVLPREYPLLSTQVLHRAHKEVYTVQVKHPVYHQLFGSFEPGLSVLDALMNEGPEAAILVRQSATMSS
ncbi:MAG: WbqC family protein [candidate division KSB1 bacterium]|nr:WbqC family protein [candidate division KSB1 bacterium]